jgi:ribose/xylose/arabinose/galactoside ABC-type transport system permease subunit
VTVDEDRASDRRIAVAFAAVLLVEVILAFMADAGTYPLWVWLILAIVAVLVAGLVFGWVQARAEGTPFWRPRRFATRRRS